LKLNTDRINDDITKMVVIRDLVEMMRNGRYDPEIFVSFAKNMVKDFYNN
jgi:hypothetical protein